MKQRRGGCCTLKMSLHCFLICTVYNKQFDVILIFFPLCITRCFYCMFLFGVDFFMRLAFTEHLGYVGCSFHSVWKVFGHYFFQYFSTSPLQGFRPPDIRTCERVRFTNGMTTRNLKKWKQERQWFLLHPDLTPSLRCTPLYRSHQPFWLRRPAHSYLPSPLTWLMNKGATPNQKINTLKCGIIYLFLITTYFQYMMLCYKEINFRHFSWDKIY